MTVEVKRSLDDQLLEFRESRFLAMPIAGAIAWTLIGLVGALGNPFASVWAVFIGSGMIFYLGIGVAKLIGEDLLGRGRDSNLFDRIFLLTTLQAVLVYAIAIPFFWEETTSLPLTVGILTGLMWIPFTALSGHWVGLFHGIARTVLIAVAYFLWPDLRFIAIPAVIVAVYMITIYVLAQRARSLASDTQAA